MVNVPDVTATPSQPPSTHIEVDEPDLDLADAGLTPYSTEGPGGISPADHEQLREKPIYVDHFGGAAGATLLQPSVRPQSGYNNYATQVPDTQNNPYAPFISEIDWKVAHWAKTRGPSSTAFSDLLAIDGLASALGLSYTNTKELNKMIDVDIPHQRPEFKVLELKLTSGETFPLYARDILSCVRALYGDPEHVQYLCITPERHYADADKTIRLYHDLHTGHWWWSTQKQLEDENPGATVVPIILSSDKTQVTLFRNKTAYPVYLTIGNLPKSIRRKPSRQGQILLAYLPTSRLNHVTNNAQRRRILTNLFHACMRVLVKPLEEAGINGIIIASGDGVQRRCHPILAVYVGDYPEQCLVTGTFNGECPSCECPHDDLGCVPPCPYPYRDLTDVLSALNTAGSPRHAQICRDANIKPVQNPFWQYLPYVDIFQAITPDVLHQLYQGVFKHLVSWLTAACGASEIDRRVRCLPPNHSVRIFHKGITTLTRVTGTEHKQIGTFLLGLIVDAPLDDPSLTAPLLRATRALMDFLYIAQYSAHTDTTLHALKSALQAFHDDRNVFVELGVRTGFNIPKLHSLHHYVRAIKLFGTTDNYNTEATERLHIDLAKDAYRSTNHRDEFPQMTRWLERREKILHHANYIAWRLQQVPISPLSISAHHDIRWHPPDMACELRVKMTLHPTHKAIPLHDIISPSNYGATFFIPALARFIVQFNNPTITPRQLEELAADISLPFTALPVFHKIKFWNEDVHGKKTLDSIHVHPRRTVVGPSHGEVTMPARFDTALVRVRAGVQQLGVTSGLRLHGSLQGMRVGRVHIVFTLPDKVRDHLFRPGHHPPRHLAYIEWFSKFLSSPDANLCMYKIKRLMGEARLASVLPVTLIERSVHLLPKWGGNVPDSWTTENVLDECLTFFVNPFKDAHTYYNLY
ncbi:hypothetical protein BC628DRAFT_1423760 [Trametes gibbosa]|nr:hypothetical protein BC628DRAFT_1423760 [Trametes gibbosa]